MKRKLKVIRIFLKHLKRENEMYQSNFLFQFYQILSFSMMFCYNSAWWHHNAKSTIWNIYSTAMTDLFL